MEALLEEIFNYLVAHYALYLVVVMGVLMALIVLLLNVLKKPIKKLTSKIQSERLRKLANKGIIILSFGLAVLVWWLLHHFFPQYFEFRTVDIILSGALPIVLYSFGDGVISASKARNIIETCKDIADDGKVEKDEVKELINEMSSDETVEESQSAKEAENELDNLLK